jgi:hypothetical protein
MPPVGFEPTISADERSQGYAVERAATGTGTFVSFPFNNTGLSKKMNGIWNRYNLKSTGRIYTFGMLKCSEKFKDLDLP